MIGMTDYMLYKELYKEALAATGYSVIKTEDLEQLRAQKVSLEMLLAETVEVSGAEYESRIKQLRAELEEAREAMEWMMLDPDDGYDRAKLWLSAHSAPSKKGE